MVARDYVECELPNKGDIVTFSYDSYARRSEPVNPSIIRIRQDMTWDDVVRNYESEAPVQDPNTGNLLSELYHFSTLFLLSLLFLADFPFLETPTKIMKYTEQPQGHWTSKSGSNLRFFFEEFAKNRSLDPHLPETWYNISRQAIGEVPVSIGRKEGSR